VDSSIDFLIFGQLYFFDGVDFIVNLVFGFKDRSEAPLPNLINLFEVVLVSIIGGHGTQRSQSFFRQLICLRFLGYFSYLSSDCNLLGVLVYGQLLSPSFIFLHLSLKALLMLLLKLNISLLNLLLPVFDFLLLSNANFLLFF
jgi:hypothetical protein